MTPKAKIVIGVLIFAVMILFACSTLPTPGQASNLEYTDNAYLRCLDKALLESRSTLVCSITTWMNFYPAIMFGSVFFLALIGVGPLVGKIFSGERQ